MDCAMLQSADICPGIHILQFLVSLSSELDTWQLGVKAGSLKRLPCEEFNLFIWNFSA